MSRTVALHDPIAALDPYHQLHVMELLQETACQGKTVVVVLHDLTLTVRFCGRLVLLDAGRVVADGSPETVLCAINLARVYRVAVLHGTHDQKLYVLPWTRQPDAEARATGPPHAPRVGGDSVRPGQCSNPAEVPQRKA